MCVCVCVWICVAIKHNGISTHNDGCDEWACDSYLHSFQQTRKEQPVQNETQSVSLFYWVNGFSNWSIFTRNTCISPSIETDISRDIIVVMHNNKQLLLWKRNSLHCISLVSNSLKWLAIKDPEKQFYHIKASFPVWECWCQCFPPLCRHKTPASLDKNFTMEQSYKTSLYNTKDWPCGWYNYTNIFLLKWF